MTGKRATRDPDGRRRAIITATAELILELGLHQVSHRKIAERAGVPLGSTTQYFASLDELLTTALGELATSGQQQVEDLRRMLAASPDRPRALARSFSDYLGDRERVRAEAIFYVANIEHPHMRELTADWYDSLEELIGEFTDAASARSVLLYLDGLMMSACVRDALPAEDEITTAIRRLMGV